jgi:hypothetical protein
MMTSFWFSLVFFNFIYLSTLREKVARGRYSFYKQSEKEASHTSGASFARLIWSPDEESVGRSVRIEDIGRLASADPSTFDSSSLKSWD